MTTLSTLLAPDTYQWKLSLIAMLGYIVLPMLAGSVLTLIPALKQTRQLNRDVAAQRLSRESYQPIQIRSMSWGVVLQIVFFVLVVPFIITAAPQAWWKIPVHVVAILMVYDFFYYLTHRFLFHNGGIGEGPLLWMHAVHHRQHNPCRKDSSYLHPLETCIGTALFFATMGMMGWLLGDLHIVTVVITAVAFAEINLHNHDRMEADHAPFKYLKYASDMHHVHHRKFTAGNYATITLFYDWLFGTYDTGDGWGKNRKVAKTASAVPAPEAETVAA